MKRWMHDISVFMVMAISLFAITSCGLVDFDFDETLQERYEMQLNKEIVYIMEGDSFSLSPVYTPEVIGGDVFWSVSNDILDIRDNTIYAKNVGQAYVKAYSPIQDLEDSCRVCVMPQWKTPVYDYPDETIINARVKYKGRQIDPTKVKVGAFINGECRALGEMKDCFGTIIIQFRVCGNIDTDDVIRFRLYYLDELVCSYFPQTLHFDGETYGSMGAFFILNM